MAQVQLSDNQVYDFPDDATPEEIQKFDLQQQMQRTRGEDRFSNWFAQQNQSPSGLIQSALQGGESAIGGAVKGVGVLSEMVPPGFSSDVEFAPSEFEDFRAQRAARKPSEVMRDIQQNPLYVAGQALQDVAPEVHPVPDNEKESFLTKTAKSLGEFAPIVATGPLAPVTIGLQSLGEHIGADFDAGKASGKSDDEAAASAMNKALVSGGLQAAIFAILPKPLRDLGDKYLVDKFGNEAARFIAKRAAAAGETGAIFGASHIGEQAIEGQPLTQGLPEAIGAGLLMGAATPRGPSAAEQEMMGPPSNFFDARQEALKASLPPDQQLPPALLSPTQDVPLRGTWRKRITPITEGETNATITGQEKPQSELPRTETGTDLRPNAAEVRPDESTQTNDSDQSKGSGNVQPVAGQTPTDEAGVKLPPLPPNHQLIEIERADGTKYQAAFGGYWNDLPNKPPVISRVNGDTWSTGSLNEGERIASEIQPDAAPVEPAAKGAIAPAQGEVSGKTPTEAETKQTPKSSTQLTLPPVESKPFIDFAKSIPDNEVYHKADESGKEDYGIETEPHITALFGLTGHTPGPVAKAIADHGPITVKLGKLSVFENPDYDVLKVGVSGPALHDLNAKLAKLPNEQTFSDYRPHLTIAYLKKGEGKKYVGDERFDGKEITFNSLTFSPPKEIRAETGRPELPLVEPSKTIPKQIREMGEEITTSQGEKIKTGIENEGETKQEQAGLPGDNREGMAGLPLPDRERVGRDLEASGKVLRQTDDEVAKLFADAGRNPGQSGQSDQNRSRHDRLQPEVHSGSQKTTSPIFEKTQVFISEPSKDSRSALVRQDIGILANRIVHGASEDVAAGHVGSSDFNKTLADKLKGLKFVFVDHENPDVHAFYDPSSDSVVINSKAVSTYDLSKPGSLDTWDSVIGEELIHAVTWRVSTGKEREAVWKSLSDAEKIEVRKAYNRDFKNDEHRGAEYIRMIVQDRLNGRVTERFDPSRITAAAQKILQKVVDYLRETFGGKPENDIARQIIDRIEGAINGRVPIERSVFEPGSESIASGIRQDQNPSADDERYGDIIQIAGQDYNILGKDKITPQQKQAADSKVHSLAEKLKLPGAPDLTVGVRRGSTDPNVVFRVKADGFNYDTEGRALIDHITEQIRSQHIQGGDPAYVSSMVNMVNKNFNEGNWNGVFSPPLINELLSVTAAESSFRGQMLRAITGLRDDLTGIAHNADIFLRRTYAQAFGGNGLVDSVIKRIATDFRQYFTESELDGIFASHPALGEFFDRVKLLMRQESGDRLYNIIQGKFKPKTAKKLSALESKAILNEEASKIIEQLAKMGIKPKEVPGKKKLEPMEALKLMMASKTRDRIEADVERAIANGERNAGIKESLAQEKNSEHRAEMESLFASGVEEPTPEMIDAGLERPEFAHWKTIRENWTGYSPTSIDLVRKVIRGDFKGTRFEDPKVQPVDTRINLDALAKSPEAEVTRVMDAYMENVRKQIDLDSASPESKAKVEKLIKDAVGEQLQKAKQRVLDNYFSVKDLANSPTASQRLKQLLNAGVSQDPRFSTDRVRQLIKRVSGEYIKDTNFDALATSTRIEKSQWLETKSQEIARAENFNGLDEKTREYLDAVVRTDLAERIQAGEEKVTRQFLKGADVSYEAKPVDPKAREQSLEAAKSKLEGVIRAGGFDSSMVERLAGKSAISKLTPKLGDLIKQVFDTPIYRQGELGERFSDALVKQLGIDPAQADKARAVFDQAFGDKFKEARARALAQAKESLSPKEKVIFSKRSLWQKIERLVNAGGLDSADLLQQIAKERGYAIPDAEDVAGLKDLAVREQQLRELNPDKLSELESAGKTPQEIEEARQKVEAATLYKRADLIKRMGVIWSRMVRPLPIAKNPGTMAKLWWEHKRNWAQALNEFETFNMLAKAGFTLYRLPMHLTTQLLGHLPTRAIGRAMELHKVDLANGNSTHFWKDVSTAMQDSVQATFRALRPALVAARAEMLGRGESRNVDRLLGGINSVERLFLKAKNYWDNGDYARSAIAHLFAWPRVVGWYISAVDHWQGTPVEYQEMIHQIEISMREKGRSSAEIEAFKNHVFDMMRDQAVGASAEAKQILQDKGESPSNLEANEAGWQIVRRNIYGEMKRAGLSADDFEADNKILADTQSWQVPTNRGVGMYAATPVKLLGKVFEATGLPVSFGRFSNAIATSINYSLMWTPLYKLANIPGIGMEGSQPSTWFRTDLDRSQRLAQALLGTSMGGMALGLMAAGVMRMNPPWIQDKGERDKFEREGHRANTAEFLLPNGQFIPISVLVGPLTLIAPYLYAGGAVQQLMEKRAKEQNRLNEEAKRHGVPPGKIAPIGVVDVMTIGGATAWGAILGNRTVSGLTAAATEYGSLNAKKQISAYISPLIPALPGYQEVSRMEGVQLDSKLASVWDYLVPMPTSGARAVNMLGDPTGTPNDIQRIVQVITSGSYPWPVDPKDAQAQKPYAVLFASGYHPPAISPERGYVINGELRPMNDAELQKFTQARGDNFKQILSTMSPSSDPGAAGAVSQALQQATAMALSAVGATPIREIGMAGQGQAGPETGKGPPSGLPSGVSRSGLSLPAGLGGSVGQSGGGGASGGSSSSGFGAPRLRSSLGRVGTPRIRPGGVLARARRLVTGRLPRRSSGRIRVGQVGRRRRIRAV